MITPAQTHICPVLVVLSNEERALVCTPREVGHLLITMNRLISLSGCKINVRFGDDYISPNTPNVYYTFEAEEARRLEA